MTEQHSRPDKFTKHSIRTGRFEILREKHRVEETIRFGEDVTIGKTGNLRKGGDQNMNVLVTAGNTQTPLDQVRCITNIFSGRTGTQIAARAFERGHALVLVTSHPDIVEAIPANRKREQPAWRLRPYRTFEDLERVMAEEVLGGQPDAVIHAAAVSDYRSAGIFTPSPDTRFDETNLAWETTGEQPRLRDAAAGKVKSSHAELWLRLAPTPKLIDRIRSDWKFTGILVKFKLEVGLMEQQLERIAEEARVHSAADLMVANTLEGMHDWALLGDGGAGYRKVSRADLADRLLDAVEVLSGSR